MKGFYIYTHGHFIIYTLLVLGRPFCFQNCYNSSCHRFNKMLETFIRILHSGCRFVHPKGALLDGELVAV